jgi:hypothetical protein
MRWFDLSILVVLAACSSAPDSADDDVSGGVGSGGAAALSDAGSGGVGGNGGSARVDAGGAGKGGASTAGRSGTGGAAGSGGATGSGGSRPPPDTCIDAGTCAPGVWVDVTPPNASLHTPQSCANYGTLSALVNAVHPETLYTEFNCQGIWKSTDYGLTWNGPVNVGANGATVSDCQGGISVPPNSPTPMVYEACIGGAAYGFWASTNGGVDWTKHDVAPGGQRQDFYPPLVDPYDGDHLLMEGHEDNILAESTDAGQSWTAVNILPQMQAGGGTGALVFIDMSNAEATRNTWLYLPQASGGTIGTWRTTDGGAHWTRVDSNEKEHSYYQIYQPDSLGAVFMAGIYSSLGNGVLRSTDYGQTWAHVGLTQNENIVFGTPKHIYAMDAYGGQKLEVTDPPGNGTWTSPGTPAAMAGPAGGCAIMDAQGINRGGYCGGAVQAAVTSDGTHHVIVTANWNAGLWRYVEP